MVQAMLFSAGHLHIRHQAQVVHPFGVQVVAAENRLVRVVADLGAVLVTVKVL